MLLVGGLGHEFYFPYFFGLMVVLRVVNYYLIGGSKHLLFSISYMGMSSFPLTNSIIFQDGEITPPTRLVYGTGEG